MRRSQNIIIYAGGILLAIVCFMVVCLSDAIGYYFKQPQSLPNPVLLPIGMAIFAFVGLLGKTIATRALKKGREDRSIFRGVLIFAVLSFFLLVYLCYQYYFRTGWDVDILFIGSMRLMSGGDISVLEGYLAQYPNNVLLVILQSLILKVNMMFGIFPEMEGLFSLVIFQCGIVAAAGVLLYDVLKKLTGGAETAMAGYAVYQLFFFTSPWTVIPYSDTIGLIFPLLVLDLAITETGGAWRRVLRWAIIGGITYIGFQIKPQLAILTIAAVLVALTKLVGKGAIKQWFRQLPALAAMLLVFVLMSAVVPSVQEQILPTKQYEDRNMIPTHYVMMGLNTERDGAYVYEDVEFSVAQLNKQLRREENLRVIRERLSALGIGGLSAHLAKKTLSCYDDGTFFWGREGNFYNQIPEKKNTFLSPLLREIFYNDGAYFASFRLFRQAIWLAALLLAAIGALYVKKDGADRAGIAIVFLAIIGLTMFELLFEARSRYLYSYVPIYLTAAVMGWEVLAGKIKARRK